VVVVEQCDGELSADIAWLDRWHHPRSPDGNGAGSAVVGRSAARRRACAWVNQQDGPVVSEQLLLAAPSAHAMLAFEYCDDEWTGGMGWLVSRRELSTSDDGMPNAWEAGNRAAERWLEDHGGRIGQAPPG
jgi:hypothetical protein